MCIETYSIFEMLLFHMENLLTGVSIRNIGIRTYYQRLKNIMLEVEVYQL